MNVTIRYDDKRIEAAIELFYINRCNRSGETVKHPHIDRNVLILTVDTIIL